MNDLTEIFKKGISNSQNYNKYTVINKINTLFNINCSDADRYNWCLIWETLSDSNNVIYGYLSQHYPVAIVNNNCRDDLLKILNELSISIAHFNEPFCCDESILKKYAPYTQIIDDRFLESTDFSLDDDRLYDIYQGIKYVTPYCFRFDEIDVGT